MVTINQRLVHFFKFVVTLILFIVIYAQIKNNHSSFSLIFPLSPQRWIGILIILLLAPVNWLLECIKWKTILISDKVITIRQAWHAVLSGYTLGLITPARIGDYLGRASSFSGKSITALVATFHSSLWQNLVNLLVGILGILWLIIRFENIYLKLALISAIILIFILSLFLTYRDGSNKLIHWSIELVKKHLKFINLPDFKTIRFPEYNTVKLLSYSILRYSIYLAQYAICALSFGINANFLTLISIISSVLLIQSMIPLPFVAGLLSRAQISMLVWSLAGVGIEIALAISILIWLINIVLPALIGLNYILRKKSLIKPIIN